MFSWIVCPNRGEYRRRCETAGEVRQANQEVSHRKLPGRRSVAFKRAAFPMGAPPADRGLSDVPSKLFSNVL